MLDLVASQLRMDLGREFGLRHLQYAYQERAGGMAEALGLAEDFVHGEKCVVIEAARA